MPVLPDCELIPVRELTRQIFGRRVSPSCLWRWRTRGLRGIKLSVTFAGGHWCASEEGFRAWMAETSAAAARGRGGAAPGAEPAGRSPETVARLQAAGLLPKEGGQ